MPTISGGWISFDSSSLPKYPYVVKLFSLNYKFVNSLAKIEKIVILQFNDQNCLILDLVLSGPRSTSGIVDSQQNNSYNLNSKSNK